MILCQAEPNVESTFWLVYQEAVRRAAEVTLPMWRASNGRYGWVSGQLDPRYMFDTDRMMEQALQIARLAPNLMVKVPGTRQGYEVIRQLVGRGISINNTLSYTLPQFMACIRAVEAGRAEARCRGTDATPWRAVITDMIGRFGSNGDLSDEAAARGIDLSQTEIRWAEVAILKRIHRIIREKGYPVKMLLSSLSVDEPSRGTGSLSMHLEQTAGADIAYTCKPQFIADVMRRESEIDTFDRTAIDREIPAHVLEKLMKLPYFRRAFEPDGMSPEEFSSYGAFVTTYAEVIRSTRRLVDFVAYQFQTMSDQADRILVRAAK
jgi:transaldolase